VLSSIGESPFVTYAPQSPPEPGADAEPADLLWFEQKYSLSAKALVWAGASERSWQEIGARMLRSAGVDDGTQEDIRGSYIEIIRQVLSGIAGALSSRAGKEVACEEGSEKAPSLRDAPAFTLEISVGDVEFPVVVVFSPMLLEVLDPASPPETPAETEQAAKSPAKSSAGIGPKTGSIDLLLDVELPVSISFGRAQLALKDVIKLTTGSIVELNRAVSEPVDVIVNNCVIARGEVVVVEGNFGVRIRQVISRQERLRTLY
jgi:flagellar motor switch protein FliN/FliY